MFIKADHPRLMRRARHGVIAREVERALRLVPAVLVVVRDDAQALRGRATLLHGVRHEARRRLRVRAVVSVVRHAELHVRALEEEVLAIRL